MFRGPRGRLAMSTELPSLNKEITYLLTYLVNLLASHEMHKEDYGGMSCNKMEEMDRRRKMVEIGCMP